MKKVEIQVRIVNFNSEGIFADAAAPYSALEPLASLVSPEAHHTLALDQASFLDSRDKQVLNTNKTVVFSSNSH